jgi:hypothetical protein
MLALWGQAFCLFCSLLYPQSLGWCVAHSRPAVNMCWMNECTSFEFFNDITRFTVYNVRFMDVRPNS